MKRIKEFTTCKKAVIKLLDECIAYEEIGILEAERRKRKYNDHKKRLEREVRNESV